MKKGSPVFVLSDAPAILLCGWIKKSQKKVSLVAPDFTKPQNARKEAGVGWRPTQTLKGEHPHPMHHKKSRSFTKASGIPRHVSLSSPHTGSI